MQNAALYFDAKDWGMKTGANITFYGSESKSNNENSVQEPFSINSSQNVTRLQTYIDKSHNLKRSWSIGYGVEFSFANNHNLQNYSVQSGLTDYNSEVSQNEYTYNAYFRFSKIFSQQFNLSASLSGEYYKYGALDRFNFYPQITSSWYSKDYNHIFQLNVTTNKNYPQFWEMSNATSYINNYTVAKGNTELIPSVNYFVQLSYILKQKYSLTLYNLYSDKYFVQLPYQSSDTLQLIYQTTNFDFMQRTGIAVVLPFTAKFYDTNLSLNVYYQRAKNSHFHDIAFDVSKISAYASWDNNFTISQKPNLKFNIQAIAITNSLQGAGVIPATAWLNSGLKWIFANKKAEFNLRADDIFNSQPRGLSLHHNTQNLKFDVFPDYRSVSISFSYKFNANFTAKERKEVDTSRFGIKEK
jgi:hypothetical protein